MLGYCTNVHSGDSFVEVVENLSTYSAAVGRNLQKPLGVGLWLSDKASIETNISLLKDTLQECNLQVFTLNGFPFSNFHQDVVRHIVYKPDWSQETRLNYTIRLARILSEITSQDEASISTLPLGWKDASFSNETCATQLRLCVNELEKIEQETGKCIHLDIETEPGCRLQTSKDLSTFFIKQFNDDEHIRKYIRVCHDTCHAAVMRESAEECVSNYQSVGLRIGKVQVSSAVEFELELGTNTSFILEEQTYLHQTTVQIEDEIMFFEHFSDVPNDLRSGNCRVHFHVPIHRKLFGELQTTQHDLLKSIPVLKEAGATDWEVETYTWSVTPSSLQDEELVDSITKELQWATVQLDQ